MIFFTLYLINFKEAENFEQCGRLLRTTTYGKIRDAGNGRRPKKAATF